MTTHPDSPKDQSQPDRKFIAAITGTLQRILAAYGSQRDHINDADLDDEQPISLTVSLRLSDIRLARRFIRSRGHHPADFDVRRSR